MTPQESARTAAFTVLLLAVAAALWMLRDVLLLVGYAALLAFALDPLVAALERVRTPRGSLPRGVAAAVVMLALVAVGASVIGTLVPQLARELSRFVEGAPASVDRLLDAARAWATARGLGDALGPLGGDSPMGAAELLRRSGGALLHALGVATGSLGHLVGLLLVPILAFYLLAEREAVEKSALGFVPAELRPRVGQVIGAVDRSLRSYVHGQALICLSIGLLTGVALAVLGFPVAVLLGTVVAIAEVVPILGFWTASVAIVLAGWGVRPELALYGWLAYLAVNQAIGLLVTPRLMGRRMQLHPFVVMVSILAGGALLGPAGAVLALPLAAALQSVISEFARRPAAA